MKRVICILLAVAAVFVTAISASAVDYGCNVETVSSAVYFENLDTGAVVYEKSADTRMYPASTTKIMTYVVVADHVSDLDGTMVDIKEDVLTGLDPESTVMGLSDHVGEQYSIRELLYGMMLPSGNDAALVLADFVGSGIPGFVEMMNSKAAELGCKDTHFVNPHGLHDPNHYTTARDMAAIAKYARTLPGFMEITNTLSYTPSRFTQPITNTNYMLSSTEQGGKYYYSYTKGIKTGYTPQAGECLVASASDENLDIISVVLGGKPGAGQRFSDSKKLLTYVYDHYTYQLLADKTVPLAHLTVKKATKKTQELDVIMQTDLRAVTPNEITPENVPVTIDLPEELKAPIRKNQVLGKVTYSVDGFVYTTDLVALHDVAKKPYWLYNLLVVFALFVLFVAARTVYLQQKRKRRRKRR